MANLHCCLESFIEKECEAIFKLREGVGLENGKLCAKGLQTIIRVKFLHFLGRDTVDL